MPGKLTFACQELGYQTLMNITLAVTTLPVVNSNTMIQCSSPRESKIDTTPWTN